MQYLKVLSEGVDKGYSTLFEWTAKTLMPRFPEIMHCISSG